MKIPFTFIVLFLTYLTTAQTIELPNTIISINSDYYTSVLEENHPQIIKKLEAEILNYNFKVLKDEFDNPKDIYQVTFKLKQGKIEAFFNSKGKIVKTIEQYNDVRLPMDVMTAISNQYPNWAIVEDLCVIKYHCDTDIVKKEYQIKIKNLDQVITLKANQNGTFI